MVLLEDGQGSFEGTSGKKRCGLKSPLVVPLLLFEHCWIVIWCSIEGLTSGSYE